MKKFSDLDLLSIGNTRHIAGVLLVGEGEELVCRYPNSPAKASEPVEMEMSTSDWEKFLRQSDIMETEVMAKSKDGQIVKAIARKGSRQIDTNTSWAVYRRDNYTCRYCGNDKVPLTVDHLVCWESGGPSTEANMVACCKNCNTTRGNLSYREWIEHPRYKKVSQRLPENVRRLNQSLVDTLALIPLKYVVASR